MLYEPFHVPLPYFCELYEEKRERVKMKQTKWIQGMQVKNE